MQKYLDKARQNNLVCENPHYRKKIIDLAISNNSSGIFRDFVHKFYTFLPVDFMAENKEQQLAEIAYDAFDFVKTRSSEEVKIEFLENGEDKYSGSVLRIVAASKIYMVDSIKYVLKKYDINTEICLHPLISVQRDKKGQISKISEGYHNASHTDEYIVFAVLNNISQKTKNKIIEECKANITKVTLLDKSSAPIASKMDEVIKTVTSSPEDKHFLQWVSDKNFIFLASIDFNAKGEFNNILGDKTIIDEDLTYLQDVVKKAIAAQDDGMFLDKMSETSPLNSGKCINYILVQKNDAGTIFFGFYTRALQTQSVLNIPILNNKLNYVLERSGFKEGSYNYRKLLAIGESFPRDALFQIDEEDLYCVCLHILSAIIARTLKMFIQKDSSGEYLNVLVFMPIERLTPETHVAIVKYLTSKFETKVITDEITDVSNSFCYLYVTLEIENSLPEFSLTEIEQDLDSISRNWDSALLEVLEETLSKATGYARANIFPKEYQYKFSPSEAAKDYIFLTKLSTKRKKSFNLQRHGECDFVMKIYSEDKLVLSGILPYIENIGFKAVSQETYKISFSNEVKYICVFNLSAETPIKSSFELIKENVEEALHRLSVGDLENDILCNLILVSGLRWRQVKILKALTAYLAQTSFSYNKEYVKEVLVRHSHFAEYLIKLFESKFYPDPTEFTNSVSINKSLTSYLGEVTNSVEDRILRTMHSIVEAITRTNAYQKDAKGEFKPHVSFKLDSSKVPDIPLPLPFAEIFVYSISFEAVHLRGGKVARGGLRWSDRKEDFRTEVHGLMKAQITKNTVIVPVGSKGGFVVKADASSMDRATFKKHVVECYKNFLRGMLDITDNLVDGKIVRPKDIVAYDEDDPYLVVAADKGTATFSDYANSVSKEYNFWLGDAFASGGSAGYDHKKMAITAKGAWISVQRHFAEMGTDVQTDPITIVGIGDMSGDVFGNGLLLSKSVKLVAAFNHMHIFIDPNPDPEKSYLERKRLFELPGSKWSDYSMDILSEGGGVYERSSKNITISEAARKLLDVDTADFTPEALINCILKAPVDLIWNGGIGTYIKAAAESHLEVGDKANDSLRINGHELRAKVVGEGGNLGFSQLGRIEYAKNGGKINTDFIDNSAGVDCSDHEVNIKIALNMAMNSGKITLDERNALLENMTSEVEQLVLIDNIKQTASLTLAQFSPAYNTGMFAHLISALEDDALLSREVEFLPNDKELNRMSKSGEVLTRPELAVLLSYSKMSVYNELISSVIADDQGSDELLINYFPPMMREKFKDEILSHPLRNEIIITILTNKVINEIGSPILEHIESDTGAKLCDIIRSYIIVNRIFCLDELWKRVDKLSVEVDFDVQVEIYSEIIKLLRRGICWFVRNLPGPVDIAAAIELYCDPVEELSTKLSNYLLGTAKEKFDTRRAKYVDSNIPDELARLIATLDVGVSSLDIILVSHKTQTDKNRVAELYFKAADHFYIDWMRKSIEKQMTESYWNRMSIQAMKDDLYDKQRRVIQKILAYKSDSKDISDWINYNEKYANIFLNFVERIKNDEEVDLNMMILANKQFEIFLRRV
mgnify:CR=1 FL=1